MTSLLDPKTYLKAIQTGKTALGTIKEYTSSKPEAKKGTLEKIKNEVGGYLAKGATNIKPLPTTKEPKFDFGGVPKKTSALDFNWKPPKELDLKKPDEKFLKMGLSDQKAYIQSKGERGMYEDQLNGIYNKQFEERKKEILKESKAPKAGYKEPGDFGQTVDAVKQNTISMASAVGASLEKVGQKYNKPTLEKIGAGTADYFKKVLVKNPEWNPPEDIGKWGDPTFYVRMVGGILPSIAGAMAIGLAATPTGPAGQAIAMYEFTSSLEGGMAYQELMDAGVEHEKAVKASDKIGKINGILEQLPIFRLLNKQPGGKQTTNRLIIKIIKSMFVQGTEEGTTETMQEITSNVVMQDFFENRKLWDNTLESFVGGFLGGTAADVGASFVQSPLVVQTVKNIAKDTSGLAQMPIPGMGEELTPEEKKRKIETDKQVQYANRQDKVSDSLAPQPKITAEGRESGQLPSQTRGDVGVRPLPTGKRLQSDINAQAREIVKKPTDQITEDEKDILRQYEGAGGQEKAGETGRGLLDEYYTPRPIVQDMWALAKEYGFTEGGAVLEPSVGTGRFIEYGPKANYTGAEIDSTSAKIAAVLTKDKGAKVYNMPFEEMFVDKTGKKKDALLNHYDLVIGNPPYGSHRGYYKSLDEPSIAKYEDYFIKRGLDSLKENGLLVMVVPSGFLKTKSSAAKKLIAKQGMLLDAKRLPEKTFGTTSIGTDILVIKKVPTDSGTTINQRLEFLSGDEFFRLNPDKIQGEVKTRTNRFGKEETYVAKSKSRDELVKEGKAPEFDKQYRLTGKDSIMEGKSWKEAEVKEGLKQEIEKTKEFIKETDKKLAKVDIIEATASSGQYYKSAVPYTTEELAIWNAKNADGSIDEGKITGNQTTKLNVYKGKLYDDFDYMAGNIYEKLDQLEKEDIDSTKKTTQEKKLKSVLPKPKTIKQLDINPIGDFVQNYKISKDEKLTDMFYEYLNDLPNEAFRPSGKYETIGYLRDDKVRTYGDKKLAFVIKQRRKTMAESLFKRFLDSLDPAIQAKIEDQMNRSINAFVRPDFKKVPLVVNGLDTSFGGRGLKMPDYKLDSIGFLTNKGLGINANGVGLGKTMMAIISTVQDVQKGFYKKPLFIVPRQVYQKWIDEIKMLFPSQRVVGFGNLGTKYNVSRSEDIADKIKDGDITVMTHEALMKIGFKEETVNDLSKDLSNAYDEEAVGGTKRAEEKESAKREEMLGKGRAKAAIKVEDLGFDNIIVDEAHNFKNIFSRAKAKEGEKQAFRGRWGGLQGPSSSRGVKLWFLSQYIQKMNNGRGVKMLTATPFSNNPLEYYNMLSLLAMDEMKQMGVDNINTFMDTFIKAKHTFVVKAGGKFEMGEVIEDWQNATLLKDFIGRYIDFKDGEDFGVDRPNKHVKDHRMNPTAKQLEMIDSAQELLGAEFKEKGGTLVYIDEAKKITLSPSLSRYWKGGELSAKEFVDTSPKLSAMMSLIKANKKKTGQLIYYPLAVDSASKIQEYLITELKYKPSEVGIVTGSTSDAKRNNIRDGFNDGSIKVVIGSDAVKEGIDLQNKSTDLYITSYPWRPTDITQVEGRIHRQGNENPNVRTHFLSVSDTIDPFLFQKMETKARRLANASALDQVMDVSDIDWEQAKADLIQDPAAKLGLQREMAIQGAKTQLDAATGEKAMAQNLIEKEKFLVETIKDTRDNLSEGNSPYMKDYYEKNLKKAEKKLKEFKKKDLNMDELKARVEELTAIEKVKQEEVKAIEEDFALRAKTLPPFRQIEPKANDYTKYETEILEENKVFLIEKVVKEKPATAEEAIETEVEAVRQEAPYQEIRKRLTDFAMTPAEAAETLDVLEMTDATPEFIQEVRDYKTEIEKQMAKETAEVQAEIATDLEAIEKAAVEGKMTEDEISKSLAKVLKKNRFAFTRKGTTLDDWIDTNMAAKDWPSFVNNFLQIHKESLEKGLKWPSRPEVTDFINKLESGIMDSAEMEKVIDKLPEYLKLPFNAKRKQAQTGAKTVYPSVGSTKQVTAEPTKGGVEQGEGISEPWRLTPLQYQKAKKPGMALDRADRDVHEQFVKEAVERGEEVPDRVLEQYPWLKKAEKVDTTEITDQPGKKKAAKKIAEARELEGKDVQVNEEPAIVKTVPQIDPVGYRNRLSNVLVEYDNGMDQIVPPKDVEPVEPTDKPPAPPEKPKKRKPKKERPKPQKVDLSKLDRVRVVIQDRMLPQQRLQDKSPVTEEEDVYLAEELYSGRVTDAIETFQKEKEDVIRKKIDVLTRGDHQDLLKGLVQDYLHLKHAPERNKAHYDGAAGIKTKESIERLKLIELHPRFQDIKAAASLIQELASQLPQFLEQNELITSETVDVLQSTYKNYVPLNRIMDDETDFVNAMGIGQGFDIRGNEVKRAVGSRKQVDDIFTNVVANWERAIMRAEKNKVSQSVYKFATKYPDLGVFEIMPAIPKHLMDKDGGDYWIREAPKSPNVLSVKFDGKPKYIKINDPNIAQALKNLNVDNSNLMIKLLAPFTRFISMINTSLNPEFLISNFLRDIQQSTLNNVNDMGLSKSVKTSTRVFSAQKGIMDYYRGKDTEMSRMYKELKAEGGTTGFFNIRNHDDITKLLHTAEKEFAKGAIGMSMKAGKAVADAISVMNDIIENGTRLATYKSALEMGKSKARAAQLAKNVTVNFNKKGQLGPTINALYAFSNASIQGSFRTFKALANPKTAIPIISSIVTLSLALNAWNDWYDDDDYARIPEYEKEGNWIFMYGDGDYFKIPLPWGFNVFKVATDYAYRMGTGETTGKYGLVRTAVALLNSYNPIGGSSVVQAIMPTIARPFFDIEANTAWHGGNIRPDNFTDIKESLNYFQSTNDLFKDAAVFISKMTGGKGAKPGFIEMSPEDLEYLWAQYTGGIGRFLSRSHLTLGNMLKGEETPVTEVPFLRRVKGSVNLEKFNRGQMYDILDASKKEVLPKEERSRLLEVIKDEVKAGRFDKDTAISKMKEYDRWQEDLQLVEEKAKYIEDKGLKGEKLGKFYEALQDKAFMKKRGQDPFNKTQIKILKSYSGGVTIDSKAEAKKLAAKADTEEGLIDVVVKYAKAFSVDADSAFVTLFTGEKLKDVRGDSVIMERMSFEKSTDVKKKLAESDVLSEVKLDHTIPLELGGSNSKGNLKIVSNDDWASYTQIENYLGKKLNAGEISEKEAQALITQFKQGDISADYIYNY